MPDLVLMTVASDFGWSRVFSSLCYKGCLVGIGSFQIYQREGDFGSDILCSLHEIHPGWQTCGYPYGQRGRIFLFKKNGFSSLTSNDGLCQAGFSLFSGIMPFLTMDIKYYHETSGTSIDKELP